MDREMSPPDVQREAEKHEGVVLIDGLKPEEVRQAIKENKILLGTKADVQNALNQAGVELPRKSVEQSNSMDSWAFNVSNANNPKRERGNYQVRVMFIDGQNQAAVIDLATKDKGFGGLHKAMESVGFQNLGELGGDAFGYGSEVADEDSGRKVLSIIESLQSDK